MDTEHKTISTHETHSNTRSVHTGSSCRETKPCLQGTRLILWAWEDELITGFSSKWHRDKSELYAEWTRLYTISQKSGLHYPHCTEQHIKPSLLLSSTPFANFPLIKRFLLFALLYWLFSLSFPPSRARRGPSVSCKGWNYCLRPSY